MIIRPAAREELERFTTVGCEHADLLRAQVRDASGSQLVAPAHRPPRVIAEVSGPVDDPQGRGQREHGRQREGRRLELRRERGPPGRSGRSIRGARRVGASGRVGWGGLCHGWRPGRPDARTLTGDTKCDLRTPSSRGAPGGAAARAVPRLPREPRCWSSTSAADACRAGCAGPPGPRPPPTPRTRWRSASACRRRS